MAQEILQTCVARRGQGGFITYSLVRTITSLQYRPLISRASGEFGFLPRMTLCGTSTYVDTLCQKIPTGLENLS